MDCVRRRGKIYCAVVTVPTDLVDLVGKRQIWRSLKTESYDIARTEARKLLLTIDQLFMRMRNTMNSKLINAMTAEYALESLEMDARAARGIDPDSFLTQYLKAVRHSPEIREFAVDLVNGVAAECNNLILAGKHEAVPFSELRAGIGIGKLRRAGFIGEDVEIEQDALREVVAAFAETQKYILKVQAERLQGITEFDSDLQHRLMEKWNKDKFVKKDVGMPLPELFREYGNQWTNDNPARIKRKKAELRRIGEDFLECFSKVLGVKEIDEDVAEEWRNYTKNEGPLANKTVNNAVKTMSAVYNYALGKKRKYVECNPFSKGLKLPLVGLDSEQSRIFSDSELQKYVGVLVDNYDPEALEMTWLPLIMMYSGMRCNEVAQLYLDDVQGQEKGEIPFFRIIVNKERNQRVKTKSSREVPIHSTLQKLGFLEYVARLRGEGEVQLFPNCKYQKGTGYYYSDAMCSSLNSAINIHISTDRKLRLYSLRANFRTAIITRCTTNNVKSIIAGGTTVDGFVERVLDEIMGHTIIGGTGKKGYTKLAMPLKAEVMTLLEYPVALEQLKRLLST